MYFDVSGPWNHFEDTPTLDAALAGMAACLSDLNLHPLPSLLESCGGGANIAHKMQSKHVIQFDLHIHQTSYIAVNIKEYRNGFLTKNIK